MADGRPGDAEHDRLAILSARLQRLSPGKEEPREERLERPPESASPTDIPAADWKGVLKCVYQEINDRNLFLAAGGVTYSVLLAIFPALVALVSIYGLVSNTAQVETQVNAMAGLLPESSRQLIGTELHQIVSASGGALGIGVILGILFALWSTSRGMSGLMSALNMAYGETETRSFVRYNLVALLLSVALIIGGIIAIALLAGIPAMVAAMGSGAGGVFKWVAVILEWPVLLIAVMFVLALLYCYAPDRHPPKWRWVTPGAIAAAVLWLVASMIFGAYVANFGSYNATYGSLGAVVVLLTWLYISAFVVLLGAEINAQVEQAAAARQKGSGRMREA